MLQIEYKPLTKKKKTKQLHEIHVYMQKCKTALVVLTVRCVGKNQIKVNKSKYK